MDEQIYNDRYNGVFVRGFKCSDNTEYMKILVYPTVLENIYTISNTGQVYSLLNDSYIPWGYKNGLPYVNLSCNHDGVTSLEPFYIKDLMACNFIVNSMDYVERGCDVIYKDGDSNNNHYENIMYAPTKLEDLY